MLSFVVVGCSGTSGHQSRTNIPSSTTVGPTQHGADSLFIDSPAARDHLVIRTSTDGASVAGVAPPSRPPILSIYADGTAYLLDPPEPGDPRVNPFPSMHVASVDKAAFAKAMGRARAAGILSGQPVDFGKPAITDSPTTTATVVLPAATIRLSAYGLGSNAGLSARQRHNRAALKAFLSDIRSAAAQGPATRYEPGAYAMYAQPDRNSAAGGDHADRTPVWPLADLAGAGSPITSGSPIRCQVLTSAQEEEVLRAPGPPEADGVWTSNGIRYQLAFRPLLPDEQDCPG